MSASVTVTGLNELIKTLEAMDKNVSAVLEEAALAGAEVIRGPAAANAPPGHSKDVIKEVTSKTAESVTVKIGNRKSWWPAVFFEFGAKAHPISVKGKKVLASGDKVFGPNVSHPGLTAQPFIHPAYEGKKKEAQRVMQAILQRAVMK